jgi:hypothetical protein
VKAQDKLYGNFALGNMPAGGNVFFNLSMVGGFDRHTITFLNAYSPGTFNPGFDVATIGAGIVITVMSADFVQSVGGPTTVTQTTTPAPSSGSINLTKTGTISSGSNVINFAPGITDMVVTTIFTVGPGSDTTALVDTILEPIPRVTPEPASLVLMGLALTGFGVFGLRRKS